jgi:hypothetical protein
MRGIRLERIDRVDGIDVYRVDGHRIRNRIDVDFTNGHHHFSRRYVPLREVWLDREGKAPESRFWTKRQLFERELMARGLTYLQAVRRGGVFERRLRGAGQRPRQVRLAHLGPAGPREVWLVSGRAVRDRFYIDFTLGGHGFRYRFIPRGEIWIDDAVHPAEHGAIVHHEMVEVDLMRRGLSYDEAHARASEAEIAFRRRVRLSHYRD